MGLLIEAVTQSLDDVVYETNAAVECAEVRGVDDSLLFMFVATDTANRTDWYLLRASTNELTVLASGWYEGLSIVQAVSVGGGSVVVHDGGDKFVVFHTTNSGSVSWSGVYTFTPVNTRTTGSGITGTTTSGLLLRFWGTGTKSIAPRISAAGTDQWGRTFTVSGTTIMAAASSEQHFYDWAANDTDKHVAGGFDPQSANHFTDGYSLVFGIHAYGTVGGFNRAPAAYIARWDGSFSIIEKVDANITVGSGGLREHHHHQAWEGPAVFTWHTFDNVSGYDSEGVIWRYTPDSGFLATLHPGGVNDDLQANGVGRGELVAGSCNENWYIATITSKPVGGGNGRSYARIISHDSDGNWQYENGNNANVEPLPFDSTLGGATGSGRTGAFFVVTWADATTRYVRSYYDISKLSVPYLRMNRRDAAERNPGARQAGNIQSSIRNMGGKIYV